MERTSINPWTWSTKLGFDQAERSRVTGASSSAADRTRSTRMATRSTRGHGEATRTRPRQPGGRPGRRGHDPRQRRPADAYTTDVDELFKYWPSLAGRFSGFDGGFATSVLGVSRLGAPQLLVLLEATARRLSGRASWERKRRSRRGQTAGSSLPPSRSRRPPWRPCRPWPPPWALSPACLPRSSPSTFSAARLALGGARLGGYRRRGLVGRARLLDRLDGGLGLVREAALALGDVLELVGVLFDALAPAPLVDQALRLLSQLLQIHLVLLVSDQC